jgi:hypothetical protein
MTWTEILNAQRIDLVPYDKKNPDDTCHVEELNLLDLHVVAKEDPNIVELHWVISDRPAEVGAEGLLEQDRLRIVVVGGEMNAEGLTLRSYVSKKRPNAKGLIDMYSRLGFTITEEDDYHIITRIPDWNMEETPEEATGDVGKWLNDVKDKPMSKRWKNRLDENKPSGNGQHLVCGCPCHVPALEGPQLDHTCCGEPGKQHA